jgi:hypothetical protein
MHQQPNGQLQTQHKQKNKYEISGFYGNEFED